MTEHPKSTEVKPTTDAAAIPGPLRRHEAVYLLYSPNDNISAGNDTRIAA